MVSLVGILNITPDSFSDGGLYVSPKAALRQAEQLFKDGAAIVDVGGESTNPQSNPITAEEEWQRLAPVLEVLLQRYPGKISLDSHHPKTIRKAVKLGPFIINDVTGFNDPDMQAVAAELCLPVIISHLPAEHDTDILAAHKSDHPMDSVEEVAKELLQRQQELVSKGVPKGQIILDPGIGFGKTIELNTKLLEFPAYIKNLDHTVKVMVGYSRKRFLGENRMDLEPNLQAGLIAIASGADYLRVHDVVGHMRII
jgi:dihydropteroate synthase